MRWARKVVNDAAAYLRSLAELRGRNVEWAEETVRSGANLAANEALEQGVIDLVAADLTELLEAINGRTVTIAGVERTLDTAGAEVQTIEPDWRYELLGIITDPNVAYILLMIGIYALILEFYNPGIGVGAVTGVICLLLGAFALQMLPINYAGLALIAVGVAMLAVEAFTPSFGIVGTGGVIAFVIGSVILMDTDLPGYKVSTPIIAAFTAVSVGVVAFGLGAALRMRRARVATGIESMVGATAQVMEDFTASGRGACLRRSLERARRRRVPPGRRRGDFGGGRRHRASETRRAGKPGALGLRPWRSTTMPRRSAKGAKENRGGLASPVALPPLRALPSAWRCRGSAASNG